MSRLSMKVASSPISLLCSSCSANLHHQNVCSAKYQPFTGRCGHTFCLNCLMSQKQYLYCAKCKKNVPNKAECFIFNSDIATLTAGYVNSGTPQKNDPFERNNFFTAQRGNHQNNEGSAGRSPIDRGVSTLRRGMPMDIERPWTAHRFTTPPPLREQASTSANPGQFFSNFKSFNKLYPVLNRPSDTIEGGNANEVRDGQMSSPPLNRNSHGQDDSNLEYINPHSAYFRI